MNSNLAILKLALDRASVECACIRLKDGRMLEIDCSCRCWCQLDSATDPQS